MECGGGEGIRFVWTGCGGHTPVFKQRCSVCAQVSTGKNIKKAYNAIQVVCIYIYKTILKKGVKYIPLKDCSSSYKDQNRTVNTYKNNNQLVYIQIYSKPL